MSTKKKPTKARDGSLQPRVPTQIRMSEDQIERVREYQKKLQRLTGTDVNFSSTLRALIEKGLEAG